MKIFRKKYSAEWVEESFTFDRAAGRQIARSSRASGFIGSSFDKKKMVFFLVSAGIIFMVFVLRVFFLQIVRGADYRSLAENNRERTLPVIAERGIIFDRNNEPLTKNVPNFSLAIIPQDLPRSLEERERVIVRLAEITDTPVAQIRETIETYRSYRFETVVITEDIPYEKALLILIKAGDLPGITIRQGSKRLYAEGLSHALGYVGKLNRAELDALYQSGYLPSDSIGKTGVEKMYEAALRGAYGKKRVEVNALGKEQSILSQVDPIPGKHIVLSLDKEIQNALTEILARKLKQIGKSRAAAIVLNPNSGEALALVSLPGFDNNHFSGGISAPQYRSYIEDKDEPLFFRAISGVYPSGSTIKPAIGAAALQEGIIDARTSFVSVGGVRIGARLFPDWLIGGHGTTDIRKSLAWSVNTFYYYIGGGYGDFEGLGISRLYSYLVNFGFGKKLGIDLPGEASGLVPEPNWKKEAVDEQWYIGDTYNLSIGQGYFLATPLQVSVMTAAIANGGTIFKPRVLSGIIDPLTKEIDKIKPSIISKNVVDSGNAKIIGLGMRDCVVSGSCQRLNSLPFATAGKTGTAQNANKDSHAWFTSYGPYEKPEIVLTILIEEGGEGGIVATPVAEEFYRWWWKYKKTVENHI